jgi:hypothetical protein
MFNDSVIDLTDNEPSASVEETNPFVHGSASGLQDDLDRLAARFLAGLSYPLVDDTVLLKGLNFELVRF